MKWKLEELKWHAVDLDGCLARTSLDNLDLKDAEPIEEVVELVRELDKQGKKIIIYTARHWEQYPAIESWLAKHNVPYKTIVCGKLLAEVYWDDRAKNPFCKECRR